MRLNSNLLKVFSAGFAKRWATFLVNVLNDDVQNVGIQVITKSSAIHLKLSTRNLTERATYDYMAIYFSMKLGKKYRFYLTVGQVFLCFPKSYGSVHKWRHSFLGLFWPPLPPMSLFVIFGRPPPYNDVMFDQPPPLKSLWYICLCQLFVVFLT